MASFTPWLRIFYRLCHVHETSPGTHTLFPTYTCPVYCWRSVQLLDFSLFGNLIHASQPIRVSCPVGTTFTGQCFASGFLQTPPRDDAFAIGCTLPTAGRVGVGSSDGAVVSVSIACHLNPCMRFSHTRLSDTRLPAAFKRLPRIFSYSDNKSTLFHWLHTTFEIHTAHALCISSVFSCNTPVSIASSTRIHQAV